MILFFYCLFSVTLGSLLTLVHIIETPLPIYRNTLFIILLQIIILSILVIGLITNTVSCDQDPIITILSIHDLRECVTGIFRIFTFHDFIHDSGNLGITPYSFHKIPEFSLCYPSHAFHKICFRTILRHNIRRFLFTMNILNYNIFIFCNVPQKMVTNVSMLGMHTN